MRLARLVAILALLACTRQIDTFSLSAPVIAPVTPITPSLAVPAIVTQGSQKIAASVNAPIDGLSYEWSLVNGFLSSPSRGKTITFTAGDVGTIDFTVTAINSAGATAAPQYAQSLVVASLAGYTPTITAVSEAVTQVGPLTASIANAEPNVTYTWSIQNGAIMSATVGTAITFMGTSAGVLTLSVLATVTGAADAGVSGTKLVTVTDSDHSLTLIAGTAGGPGYVDGPATRARCCLGGLDIPMARGSDGVLYFLEPAGGAIRSLASDGSMATVVASASLQTGTAGASDLVIEQNGDFVVRNGAQLFLVHDGTVSALSKTAEALVDFESTVGASAYDANARLAGDGAGNLFVIDLEHLAVIAAYSDGTVDTSSPSTLHGSGGLCDDMDPTAFDRIDALSSTGPTLYMLDFDDNNAIIPRAWTESTQSFSVPLSATCAGINLGGTDSDDEGASLAAVAGDTPANDELFVFGNGQDAGYGLYDETGALIAGNPSAFRTTGYGGSVGDNVLFGATIAGLFVEATNPASILVHDAANGVIRRVTNLVAHAGQVSLVGGIPPNGYHATDGPNVLVQPRLTAVAPDDGTVYVYDGPSFRDQTSPSGMIDRIYRVDGSALTLLTGNIYGEHDGGSTLARLAYISGMVALPGGKLLLYDTAVNNFGATGGTLRLVDTDGSVVTVTGSPYAGQSDGAPGVATFEGHGQLALAPNGSVIVTDPFAAAVRSYSPSTGIVSTLVGGGIPGSTDGDADTATFEFPIAVTAAPSGAIYVADASNGEPRVAKIRRIDLLPTSLQVTTLTGTAIVSGATTGACASVLFSNFDSLVALADGSLVAADGGLLYRISDPDTDDCLVSVAVGSETYSGVTPALLADAVLFLPRGLSLSPNGDWIFSDETAVMRVRP